MASFTTRVELRGNPSKNDYEKLHAAMGKVGFSQTVEAAGRTFYLPHAEYDLSAEMTVQQVLELVRKAAGGVWPDHLLLVTEVKSRTWLLVPAN